MEYNSKDLQLEYQGFLETPFLWIGKGVFDLQQFEIHTNKSTQLNINLAKKLRLGKLVERFVSFELAQDTSIKLIKENLQIQDNKRTVGELDCLLEKDEKLIHLEIVYKFYLYDVSVGNSEIEHWIGPNRRDSFIQKLTKLKEKQLPLLYSSYCKPYLDKLNISLEEITQQVYFKAQLFVHLKDVDKQFSEINNNCIRGFYIYMKELEAFSDCKFYIPNKKDWLIVSHTNIEWQDFNQFKKKSNEYLERQFSPLCWMKHNNGEIKKFFLVWW